MAEMMKRIKLFYGTATMGDLDIVDRMEREILHTCPAYSRQTASSQAITKFLLTNPNKYTLTGGNYKKHKTLKRKHRKFTNKSKKNKRTRYHRKSKK